MTDLVVLQSLSYTAGAISVVLGVIYYAINLRETTRNRRVTLTTNLMQSLVSLDGIRRYRELMAMQWSDFDDFLSKYDSQVNPENWNLRNLYWTTFEVLGLQYKSRLIDFDTLYATCNILAPTMWKKFKPIIYEYRKRGVYNELYLSNFEYLANEIVKIIEKRAPSFDPSSSYLRAPIK